VYKDLECLRASFWNGCCDELSRLIKQKEIIHQLRNY